MASEVVIVVGSPGVGKSWVTNQLKDKFHVIEQDEFQNQNRYADILCDAALHGHKVLGNSPFGISELMERLAKRKISAEPVFIIEPEEILRKRYIDRDGKDIPKGHLTRQLTYKQRAKDLGSFYGTSEEVLDYLRRL